MAFTVIPWQGGYGCLQRRGVECDPIIAWAASNPRVAMSNFIRQRVSVLHSSPGTFRGCLALLPYDSVTGARCR